MNRDELQKIDLVNLEALKDAGITAPMLTEGIKYVYNMLDGLDSTLISQGAFRIANMFELANVSSMLGNLFGAGVANNSEGAFLRNGPHKYPDLIAHGPGCENVEIKFALETNSPKAHLAKEGYYLTCRYVLCDESGRYVPGVENRGSIVWIWEVRFGFLEIEHFNVSNTEGDSGKTAVVNKEGMAALSVIYCDFERCPFSAKGSTHKAYRQLYADATQERTLFSDQN